MSDMNTQTYLEDDGISLIDLFLIVWKKRILIIALSLVGLILGFAVAFIMNNNNQALSTIVEYQWDGINEGEYPNGARFEVSNAFSVSVYLNAIQMAGLDLTSNEVREQLTIRPIVPNNVLNAIQQAIENGEELTYFPTAFKYTLNLGQLGINVEEGTILLNSLLDNFKNDFESKYIQQSVVLNYALIDIDNYDYLEISEIFDTQIELIENSIDRILPQANTFISSELGVSFNDILVELGLLKNIELNNMNALINSFLLTKDINLAITRLEFTNETLRLQLAKELQVLAEIEDAISSYPGSEQTIVIPGLDGAIETTTYLEKLYDQLLSSNRIIATIQQDILFNETRITRYEDQKISNNNEAAINALNQLNEDEVGIIDRTKNELEYLVMNTNTLLEEYNLIVVKNVATNLTAPTIEEGSSVLLYSAIGLVLGGMISLGVVFIDHTMKTYKKNKLA